MRRENARRDRMALTDALLVQRQRVDSLGPAPADSTAVDLTGGAVGLALELRLSRPETIVPAPRRPGRAGAEVVPIEVDAVLIESLPYLVAVCNEVLRLHSPVVYSHRQTIAADTRIRDTAIPLNTVVVVAPGLIHRSKAVWGPAAGEFDPERWLVRTAAADTMSSCDR